jgi:selenide,water dikinase
MTDDGWIRVSSTLQSTSHPFVFAAGDCAAICRPGSATNGKGDGTGRCQTVPKAGVYAVRAGPVLIENLTRYMKLLRLGQRTSSSPDPGDEPDVSLLVRYEPQDDFLKLVVCDHEEALGFRFGLAMRGPWVWKLKDRIDRTFMDLFRVESAEGSDQEGPAASSREEPSAATSTYDTSQYDSSLDSDSSRALLSPRDAAHLLHRQDDGVDYLLAWKVLRGMANDAAYRVDVLSWSDRLLGGTRDSSAAADCPGTGKNNDATSPSTGRDQASGSRSLVL